MHDRSILSARMPRAGRQLRLAWVGLTVLSCMLWVPAHAEQTASPVPTKIAVFDLELEDLASSSTPSVDNPGSDSAVRQVSVAIRRQLADSGLYRVIDGNFSEATVVRARSLRSCDGCEAGIASQLGAQQALFGIVRRVTPADYYIWLQIRDARSGKVLDEQAGRFIGGEEGWISGVRMLIKHQIFPAGYEQPPSIVCKIAEVSPVSGFAVCIDPPGASVPPLGREDR